MKGSIFFQKDRQRWAVSWYDDVHTHKSWTITRYRGDFIYHQSIAQKLLAMMQGRYEQWEKGECDFRIEEFTGRNWSNVPEVFEEWMREFVEKNRKPATIRTAWNRYHRWIKPFFDENPVMLHEIRLPLLQKMLNYMEPLTGQGKFNVMSVFKTMMDYAVRSEKIPKMPPFPKRENYNIQANPIRWVPESTYMEVVNAIPNDKRAPFLFLVYHYRRPAEACALYKTDYDPINKCFIIKRSLSSRKLVASTKTGAAHVVPCKSEFIRIANACLNQNLNSPFLFVNPWARKDKGMWYPESLNAWWKRACRQVGVEISLYQGTKHSACTNFISEGGTVDELQMLTDHKRRDSVLKYAEITLARKREIMERKRGMKANTRNAL